MIRTKNFPVWCASWNKSHYVNGVVNAVSSHLQLITWTTGSAPGSWEETAAQWTAPLDTLQLWARWASLEPLRWLLGLLLLAGTWRCCDVGMSSNRVFKSFLKDYIYLSAHEQHPQSHNCEWENSRFYLSLSFSFYGVD